MLRKIGSSLANITLEFLRAVKTNWAYITWFLFYFLLFFVFTAGYAIYFYIVTVPLALSPMAEWLWRILSGVRTLRVKAEKERLLPLFKEVYEGAIKANPNLSRKIKLYITEDMDINAFAFGKKTMVLTRGSVELLSDESIKGLIAHEFGHFSHWHTQALLLSIVGNLPMMLILKQLFGLKNHITKEEAKESTIMRAFRGLYHIIYFFFKGIDLVGELILLRSSRRHEYQADDFASNCGYGAELAEVLTEIHNVSMGRKPSLKERLFSTHPQITLRIERLERVNENPHRG